MNEKLDLKPAEEVFVEESHECWSEAILSDDTILRYKFTLHRLFRSEGHDNNGDPIYVISGGELNCLVKSAPDELKAAKQ